MISREIYDMALASGSTSYTYDQIVGVLGEASAVNAAYEAAVVAAWEKLEEVTGGKAYIAMSDEERDMQGKLDELVNNESGGVCTKAMLGSKEFVPIGRIRKEIVSTKKYTKKIEEFFG